MDAAQALADLAEISSQVEAAVVFDAAGEVAASTLGDPKQGAEFARQAVELLAAAEGLKGSGALMQLEAATSEGSVFIVRDSETRIAATTSAEPTVGLVFYDLKSCLRSLKETAAKPKVTRKAPSRKRTPAARKDKAEE